MPLFETPHSHKERHVSHMSDYMARYNRVAFVMICITIDEHRWQWERHDLSCWMCKKPYKQRAPEKNALTQRLLFIILS